jgi:hypothetical protein
LTGEAFDVEVQDEAAKLSLPAMGYALPWLLRELGLETAGRRAVAEGWGRALGLTPTQARDGTPYAFLPDGASRLIEGAQGWSVMWEPPLAPAVPEHVEEILGTWPGSLPPALRARLPELLARSAAQPEDAPPAFVQSVPEPAVQLGLF